MRIIIPLIGIFITLQSGCTTIHYRSTGKVPVQLHSSPNFTKESSFSGKRDFFLWGQIPKAHHVFIDEEAIDHGIMGLSKVSIEEKSTFVDTLISFLSMGLYTPRSYTITGFSPRDKLVYVD